MKKQVNKKVITLVVAALSIISLSLAAFAPMNTEDVELERYGGPGTGAGTGTPANETCDEDCTADGTPVNAAVGQMGASAQGQGAGYAGSMMGTGIGLGELTDVEAQGLVMAIEEEYKARALYEYVIANFGPVAPFVEIAASEAQHASVLVRTATKYGISYPAYDPSVFSFPVFSTIEEAYQAGIDAEIEDAALYDTLMAGTDRVDLLRVYSNLQRASLESHLVEFEYYLNN